MVTFSRAAAGKKPRTCQTRCFGPERRRPAGSLIGFTCSKVELSIPSTLNSEVEARFKEENADGRGCSLTHADEFGQCANIDEEIRMLFSVPVLKQAPMA